MYYTECLQGGALSLEHQTLFNYEHPKIYVRLPLCEGSDSRCAPPAVEMYDPYAPPHLRYLSLHPPRSTVPPYGIHIGVASQQGRSGSSGDVVIVMIALYVFLSVKRVYYYYSSTVALSLGSICVFATTTRGYALMHDRLAGAGARGFSRFNTVVNFSPDGCSEARVNRQPARTRLSQHRVDKTSEDSPATICCSRECRGR
jgi:hypothetical protein